LFSSAADYNNDRNPPLVIKVFGFAEAFGLDTLALRV